MKDVVQLTGTLPNGEPVRMEFDPERCEDGWAIVEWLCAHGTEPGTHEAGWDELQRQIAAGRWK